MDKLSEKVKSTFKDGARKLTGAKRRAFQAKITTDFLGGSSRKAETVFGWGRDTVEKGKRELLSGVSYLGNYVARGNKRAEEKKPKLKAAIKSLVDPSSQVDPSFKTPFAYTTITARGVKEALINEKNYQEKELPSERTINRMLNRLGYRLRKVEKTKPKKKIPETDAIFERTHQVNQEADSNPKEIRISIDAKARMNIGNFSRGGRNRILTKAEDHDLGVKTKLTPFGFFLPQYDDLFLFFTESYASGDFIVDRIEEIWPKIQKKYGAEILTINADNGMENSSQRTQFIKRLAQFSEKSKTPIKLAYYPPYHSKYNPIERVWGIYENHIKGDIMDTVETTIKFAESMTYNGKKPIVKLIDQIYETGVKVTQKAMKKYNEFVDRLPELEKWHLNIYPGCPV